MRFWLCWRVTASASSTMNSSNTRPAIERGQSICGRDAQNLGRCSSSSAKCFQRAAIYLPEAYRTELAKLQDEVAPLPAKAIADVIQEDLGGPPDKLFAFFDVKPLGSASIGQVHAARLSDGRDVVLKVRKPGVDELVRIDLEILEGLVEE